MRGKNLLILMFALAISLSVVSAIETTDFSCQNIVQYKDEAIGKPLPEKAPFTDEIINIYLSEETYGNLEIENKTIKDFLCNENENATYQIFVQNEKVVEDFLNSEDILETYQNKTDSGEIEIKGIGLGKKIKLFFVKIALKFI
jgi:hypothetical protein